MNYKSTFREYRFRKKKIIAGALYTINYFLNLVIHYSLIQPTLDITRLKGRKRFEHYNNIRIRMPGSIWGSTLMFNSICIAFYLRNTCVFTFYIKSNRLCNTGVSIGLNNITRVVDQTKQSVTIYDSVLLWKANTQLFDIETVKTRIIFVINSVVTEFKRRGVVSEDEIYVVLVRLQPD